MSYTGYFINDFIHCHKDGLLSSLEKIEGDRKLDLEEFMLRTKKFEGTIFDGKVLGTAKVIYKTGDIYHGFLDENFMKTGLGLNLSGGKDTQLYYGTFKRN